MSRTDLRLRGRSLSAALSLAFIFLGTSTDRATADEPAPAEKAWTSALVLGDSKIGEPTGSVEWIVENCEVAVEGDVLRFVSGEGWIRYPYPLADFVFSGEYRPLKESKWDSGIYFRSPLPPEGKNWPDRRQINLKQGEEGTLLSPKVAADQAVIEPGEWRSFELSVVRDQAMLKLNGEPAWTTEGISDPTGWLALQVEVPQGGQYEFRNLTVVETSFEDLLPGDLDAWTAIEKKPLDCWALENGVLSCLPKDGPSLRTKEKIGDFSLRLSYRLAEGGNSGVYLRTPEGGSHHGDGAGIEVQLLHDDAQRYATLKPYQYSGSLYGIVPAKRGSARGADEWNAMQITCEGTSYQVILNGDVITHATADDAPELAKRAVEGFLGLQHHGGGVDYRDIRLGPPTFAP
ncbi:MAG TPA: DUF1080 domain-containing protein [Pirellulaceae bacterium]|nr:DUF1080 domain-containing protein [Pirellulaceae bacterium]